LVLPLVLASFNLPPAVPTGELPMTTPAPSADHDPPPRRGLPVLRILTWLLLGLLGFAAVTGLAIAAAWVYYHPAFDVEKGVVYGERRGAPVRRHSPPEAQRPRDHLFHQWRLEVGGTGRL